MRGEAICLLLRDSLGQVVHLTCHTLFPGVDLEKVNLYPSFAEAVSIQAGAFANPHAASFKIDYGILDTSGDKLFRFGRMGTDI